MLLFCLLLRAVNGQTGSGGSGDEDITSGSGVPVLAPTASAPVATTNVPVATTNPTTAAPTTQGVCTITTVLILS